MKRRAPPPPPRIVSRTECCCLCDRAFHVTALYSEIEATFRAEVEIGGGQVHEVVGRRRVLCGACVARVRAATERTEARSE